MLRRWRAKHMMFVLRTARSLRLRKLDRALKAGDADRVEKHLTELERCDNDIRAYSRQLEAA
jgi:hypothetical protein